MYPCFDFFTLMAKSNARIIDTMKSNTNTAIKLGQEDHKNIETIQKYGKSSQRNNKKLKISISFHLS